MDRCEPLTVVFLQTETGQMPVRDFICQQTVFDKKEIGSDIYKVQWRFPLGLPLVKKIDSSLWEIRSTISCGICRIFFTVDKSYLILLHGFIKKSQKTPKSELVNAHSRLQEYWRLRK